MLSYFYRAYPQTVLCSAGVNLPKRKRPSNVDGNRSPERTVENNLSCESDDDGMVHEDALISHDHDDGSSVASTYDPEDAGSVDALYEQTAAPSSDHIPIDDDFARSELHEHFFTSLTYMESVATRPRIRIMTVVVPLPWGGRRDEDGQDMLHEVDFIPKDTHRV